VWKLCYDAQAIPQQRLPQLPNVLPLCDTIHCFVMSDAVFSMRCAQQAPFITLEGHVGGVAALEYQQDDKFLAVARSASRQRNSATEHQLDCVAGSSGKRAAWLLGSTSILVLPFMHMNPLPPGTCPFPLPAMLCSRGGTVMVYPDPHRPTSGAGAAAAVALPPGADASARTCLGLAAVEPWLATGSERGGMVVWDVAAQRLAVEFEGLHGGAAVRAVAFLPNRPALLVSAGDDGRVCLQARA
jgi:hypothetical protein